MRARRACHGFTLIELMVVVAIIGVLAAMAIPGYQDYLRRSRFSEAAAMAEVAREAVNGYYARWGRFPADNAQAGIAPPGAYTGQYVRGLHVRDGTIRVETDGLDADRRSIYLRPMVIRDNPTGPLSWLCGTDASKVPKGLELIGKAGTDAPSNKFVPAGCR